MVNRKTSAGSVGAGQRAENRQIVQPERPTNTDTAAVDWPLRTCIHCRWPLAAVWSSLGSALYESGRWTQTARTRHTQVSRGRYKTAREKTKRIAAQRCINAAKQKNPPAVFESTAIRCQPERFTTNGRAKSNASQPSTKLCCRALNTTCSVTNTNTSHPCR